MRILRNEDSPGQPAFDPADNLHLRVLLIVVLGSCENVQPRWADALKLFTAAMAENLFLDLLHQPSLHHTPRTRARVEGGGSKVCKAQREW